MRLRHNWLMPALVIIGCWSAWLAAGPQVQRVDDHALRRGGASGDDCFRPANFRRRRAISEVNPADFAINDFLL